jgi:hypothetical protein
LATVAAWEFCSLRVYLMVSRCDRHRSHAAGVLV